jgi:Outer membrane lipoprotein-sorting protein
MPIRRRAAAAAALALLLTAAASGEDAPAPGPRVPEDYHPPAPSAREVIARAFDNFYYFDTHADLDFVVRRDGQVLFEYQTELLRKFIDGRAHDLFYFQGDGDLRGRRVLRIEHPDRADDAFVYLPQLRRIRRHVTAQRADKLAGMDVTLEDLEIQRLDKFEIVGRAFAAVDGESAHIVTLKRLLESAYDRVDFFVAASDYAMLEVRYYRDGELEPYKVTRMARGSMERFDDHVLPKRIDFEDLTAGTETTLIFRRREVDPELPRAPFSTRSLETRSHLSWIRGFGPETAE